tara:strand:+ start:299 stop:514 length:216 start_codon:yes stop_codon:yes gene_type:complete
MTQNPEERIKNLEADLAQHKQLLSFVRKRLKATMTQLDLEQKDTEMWFAKYAALKMVARNQDDISGRREHI